MFEPKGVLTTCLEERWVRVRIRFDGFCKEKLTVKRESQVGMLAMVVMMGEN